MRYARLGPSSVLVRGLIKLDLTNCYPSLKLPQNARGSFRVWGTKGVSDLRSLPFGWRFSPPICQETVEVILQRVLRKMPLLAGYVSWDDVDFDHYLDDLSSDCLWTPVS